MTVVFADVVDFTPFAERTAPERVVGVLDEIFSAFDLLAEQLGLEKIKTIGDAYMVVAGLPDPRPDHAEAGAAWHSRCSTARPAVRGTERRPPD